MASRESAGRQVNGFDLQAKMSVLLELGADVETLQLVTVLMYRRSRDGWVHDRTETLARRTAISLRKLQGCLKWLKSRNVIEQNHFTVTGGPQGAAWTWRRRVRPIREWVRQEGAQDAPSSVDISGVREEEEGAQNDRRGRTATRHISSPTEREGSRSLGSRFPRSSSRKDDEGEVFALFNRLAGHDNFGLERAKELWTSRIGRRQPYDLTVEELKDAREILANALMAQDIA